MNCIKLLLSYLNYKLNMRIKKIEIEDDPRQQWQIEYDREL